MRRLPSMRALHWSVAKAPARGLLRQMSIEARRMGCNKSRRPVRVMEVSPRDGLQNESEILPTELKVELIQKLIDLNLKHVEVGSFVSPKWVRYLCFTRSGSWGIDTFQ